ncbi:ion transporter [Periweissella cryptocerci]|uniref:Ion transporter n=1 Tax=Periweissella cryptocerci TaxID=2506420 RepID=A0A4P6YSD9_9LACO|nr:ion transporter [Periweissella cryptocerci]QBO35609.1 ion transporter [Periweissella cryptocerci]
MSLKLFTFNWDNKDKTTTKGAQQVMEKLTKWQKIYDILSAVLASVSVIIVLLDLAAVITINAEPYYLLDKIILAIFTLDYVVRFAIAKDKWRFFKGNIFDLLSIMPFDVMFSVFRISRLARLFKLFRLFSFTGRFMTRWKAFLYKTGFIYVVYVTSTLIVVSGIGFAAIEHDTLINAFWWAISTVTTVGYGDVVPHTPVGKMIGVVLMFMGIGLISSLTSAVTNFFVSEEEDDRFDQIQNQLDEIQALLIAQQSKADD